MLRLQEVACLQTDNTLKSCFTYYAHCFKQQNMSADNSYLEHVLFLNGTEILFAHLYFPSGP